MSHWRERSRPSDLQIMLPQLLLSLDRIRDQAMPPERRLAMLRSLKDQVEAIQKAQLVADLSGRSKHSDAVAHELTLEQRLGRSWCNNLQRLLIEMGQPRYHGNARFAVFREWTLRQLVRGYSGVIECAIVADLPAPGGIWRSLHELFLYLEGRDELDGRGNPVYQRLRPGDAYKRLLLIGSLGELVRADRIYREIAERLPDWAVAAELGRVHCSIGDPRYLCVDLEADRPPYRSSGKPCVESNLRGLRLPQTLCDALQPYALRTDHEPEPA